MSKPFPSAPSDLGPLGMVSTHAATQSPVSDRGGRMAHVRQRITMVLIDDNSAAREDVLARIRAQPDFHIRAASAESEATLQKVRETTPDIVVLNLPWKDDDCLTLAGALHWGSAGGPGDRHGPGAASSGYGELCPGRGLRVHHGGRVVSTHSSTPSTRSPRGFGCCHWNCPFLVWSAQSTRSRGASRSGRWTSMGSPIGNGRLPT